VAYKADINIAVKGTRQLKELRDRLEETAIQVTRQNKLLSNLTKVYDTSLVPSLNNLNRALSKASDDFKRSTLGTKAATDAAKNLVLAERAVNKELEQRSQLLNKIRGVDPNQYSKRAGPARPAHLQKVPGSDMPWQSSPVGERIQRSIQAQKEELTLQKALEKMELRKTDQINKQLNFRAKNLKMLNEEVARGKIILKLRQQRKVGSGFRDFSINAERFGAPSSPIMQGPQVSAAYQDSFLQEKRRQLKLKRQLRISKGRQAQQQMQSASANALIGGAFPLLFGQGPGAAAGGALGGFGGGMMGGQFGFALSLVGTNIGAAIDSLVTGAKELGVALNPLTADLTALTKAAGLAGTVDANRINLIEQVRGKQEALNAALREMTSVVGERGVESLQELGRQTTALTNAWNKFMTSVFAGIAEALNKSGITQGITNALNAISGADSGMGFAQSSNASSALQGRVTQLNSVNQRIATLEADLGVGGNASGSVDSQRIAKIRLGEEEYNTQLKKLETLRQESKLVKEIIAERSKFEEVINKASETKKIIDEAAFGAMLKENEVAKDTVQVGAARAELNERIRKAQDEYLKILQKVDPTIQKISSEEADRVKSAVELNDQLKRTAELSQQLRDTFVEGLASGIEGLITGTKTLKESLAGILRDFGSILLRTGLQNMMPGFGSFFGLGSAEGNYLANGIRPFASGGMVTRPTMGLVGEAGEDEYVIPASKMAQSMQRYSSGARGQSVIPGTGASSSGGASGSSTTVNYSGPILNFNSEEFVPKSAVGQIINSAASKGAAAGESRTMSTLRNSRGARARIGM
jgi:hypothetical protein